MYKPVASGALLKLLEAQDKKWDCDVCLAQNDLADKICLSCEAGLQDASAPSAPSAPSTTGFSFAPSSGTSSFTAGFPISTTSSFTTGSSLSTTSSTATSSSGFSFTSSSRETSSTGFSFATSSSTATSAPGFSFQTSSSTTAPNSFSFGGPSSFGGFNVGAASNASSSVGNSFMSDTSYSEEKGMENADPYISNEQPYFLAEELKKLVETGKVRKGDSLVLMAGDGSNSFGLGFGDDVLEITTPRIMPASVDVNFAQVVPGQTVTFAIDSSGNLWSWGMEDHGLLGRAGTDSAEPARIEVPEGSQQNPPIKISIGDTHVACLLKDGQVYCWGTFRTDCGVFGHHEDETGTIIKEQRSPFKVDFRNSTPIEDISSGCNFVAALDRKGKVYAWGVLPMNLPGYENVKDRIMKRNLQPRLIPGPKIKNIFCGAFVLYCVGNDEKVFAMGENRWQLLGQGGDKGSAIYKLGPIDALRDIKKVVGGQYHTLALTNTGCVYSWGRNAQGELGRNTKHSVSKYATLHNTEREPGITPEPITITTAPVRDICGQMDCSFYHLTDETVLACGDASCNRLGIGSEVSPGNGKSAVVIAGNDVTGNGFHILGMAAGGYIISFILRYGKRPVVRTRKRKQRRASIAASKKIKEQA